MPAETPRPEWPGTVTREQMRDWWTQTQAVLAEVARQAPMYLPDETDEGFEDFLDQASAQETYNVLIAARANADTAAGAAARLAKENQQQPQAPAMPSYARGR